MVGVGGSSPLGRTKSYRSHFPHTPFLTATVCAAMMLRYVSHGLSSASVLCASFGAGYYHKAKQRAPARDKTGFADGDDLRQK